MQRLGNLGTLRICLHSGNPAELEVERMYAPEEKGEHQENKGQRLHAGSAWVCIHGVLEVRGETEKTLSPVLQSITTHKLKFRILFPNGIPSSRWPTENSRMVFFGDILSYNAMSGLLLVFLSFSLF